jgi:hypothetical protein
MGAAKSLSLTKAPRTRFQELLFQPHFRAVTMGSERPRDCHPGSSTGESQRGKRRGHDVQTIWTSSCPRMLCSVPRLTLHMEMEASVTDQPELRL